MLLYLLESFNVLHFSKSAKFPMDPNNQPNFELDTEQNLTFDEKVTFLVTTTGEIKCISKQIGQELYEQNMLLDDLGQEMDKVKNRLDKYNNQMKEIVHSKQGPLLLIL